MVTLYRHADGFIIRNPDGTLATDPNCCCPETDCPCCYHSITLHRGSGGTMTLRVHVGACALSADQTVQAIQCDDETFVLTKSTVEGCTCYMSLATDTDAYSTDPCGQQYYTPDEDVCTYTGTETHTGTMSFREVIDITVCYDPCGEVDITINHKVYCQFGVWIHDEPDPFSPVDDTWVADGSPILVLDSTYEWAGVEAPNCTADYNIGAPTTQDVAPDYGPHTWGTAFLNCGGSSSFTVTIPGGCDATGLSLLGGGTPCDCGGPAFFSDGYFSDGYFADGYLT